MADETERSANDQAPLLSRQERVRSNGMKPIGLRQEEGLSFPEQEVRPKKGM